VFWYNPATRGLEVYAAKSLDLNADEMDADAWEHYRENASAEVAALRRVSGLPGVVGYRDVIEEPTGKLHIIME
jgi:hypothetical protein